MPSLRGTIWATLNVAGGPGINDIGSQSRRSHNVKGRESTARQDGADKVRRERDGSRVPKGSRMTLVQCVAMCQRPWGSH